MRTLFTLIAAIFIFAGFACNHQLIPDKAVAQLRAVPPVCASQGAKATARAADHQAKAQAAPTPDAAAAWTAAAGEAKHAARVEGWAGAQVGEAVEQVQPPAEFVMEQAAPVLMPLAAAAQTSTGIPWVGILTAGMTLATAWGTKRHLDANASNQAHEWEDAAACDPDLGGPTGTLDYDDPKLIAKAKRDVATKKLSKAAFRKSFPGV